MSDVAAGNGSSQGVDKADIEHYRPLLNSMFRYVTRRERGKLSLPEDNHDKTMWDGRRLSEFLRRELTEDKKEEVERAIKAATGVTYNTVVEKMPSNGVTHSMYAECAFFAVADVCNIDRVAFLAKYVRYCLPKPYKVKGFTGHDELIEELKNYYPSQPNFEIGLRIAWAQNNELGRLCRISLAKATDRLIVPAAGNKALGNVGSILTWSSRLTKLVGRDSEKQELKAWLKLPHPVSCKVLYGEGGSGKTRLAFEIAEEAKGDGWQAGEAQTEDLVGSWAFGEKGLMLILDYPEYRIEVVRALVRSLKSFLIEQDNPRLRILFVTRNLEYLDDISTEAAGLFDTPLLLTGFQSESEGQQLFDRAWDELSTLEHNGERSSGKPIVSPPLDGAVLKAWQYQPGVRLTPLVILAMTVYLFEKCSTRVTQADFSKTSISDVFRFLSKREVHRIESEVKRYKALNRAAGEDVDDLDYRSIVLLLAVSAIKDGLNIRQIEVLGPAVDEKIRYRLPEVRHLEELSVFSSARVPAVKPDLFAAAFLAYCLEKWAKGEEAYWVLYTVGLLREGGAASRGKDEQLHSSFSRLGTLIFDAKVTLRADWPVEALSHAIKDLRFLSDWVSVNLDGNRIEPSLKPLLAAALRSTLRRDAPPNVRATHYLNFSTVCVEEGEYSKSLKYIRRAVQLYRDLVDEDPLRYTPRLASSLSNLCASLRTTNEDSREEEALTVGRQALKILDDLADKSFADHAPDLARVLSNVATLLDRSGDSQTEALELYQRSIDVWDEIGGDNDIRYASDTAKCLCNFGSHLRDLGGRQQEALSYVERSLGIWELLAQQNYARHADDLATCLVTYASVLTDLDDQSEEALAAIRRAVSIYESLAAESYVRHTPDLAESLNNLSQILYGMKGRGKEAVMVAHRALKTYWNYVQDSSRGDHRLRYVHGLATCLTNYALQINNYEGYHEEAVSAINDAVRLCEILVSGNRARYMPTLERTLLYSCIIELNTDHVKALVEVRSQIHGASSEECRDKLEETLRMLLILAKEKGDEEAVGVIESFLGGREGETA